MAERFEEGIFTSKVIPKQDEGRKEENPTDGINDGDDETIDNDGIDDPLDNSPLDPKMIQLVKDRNRAAGLCDACQELFIAICKIGPDREGGRSLDPFGNDTYKETMYTDWVKGYKPTLLYFPHSNLSSLTASGKRGCGTCRVLLESLNVYRNPKYHELISEWFVAARRNHPPSHQWSVWLHPTSNNHPGEERADGHILNLVPIPDFGTSHHEPEQKSSGDELPLYSPEIPQHSLDALHLAKLWLKDCEEDHGSCNKSLGSSFLPTRVLSIRNTSPRLCLTSALPRTELVRYAALSHCWGSLDDLIRLTKANLIEFQREIPPTALCKTFRDAIEITKALGLDYLWIDSLCIIQDDGEDWKIEASLMCEVYSCCAVSIAASSAENGNGGCLFPRDPQRRWIQRVEVITEKAPAEFILLNRGISKQCIEDTPLATRAWALQEHVLAPRTLHFSSSQIYWECREKQACESLPRGLPGYHFGSNVKTWLDWAPIVQEYSSRTLTYPGDKLPALAGLAEKVHEETKNTYIAGLWLETLAWDLLWTTAAVVYQYQKPKYSNGPLDLEPSWSWAAVDSPVKVPSPKEIHPITEMTDHAFILNVEGLASGKAAFGHVRRAVLIVECEVLFTAQPLHYGLYTRVHDTTPSTLRPSFDYVNVKSGVKFFLALHTRIERIDPRKYKTGYALSKPASSHIIDFIVCGLVLEQTGLGRGEYRRIGTFQPVFESDEEVQDWVKLTKTFTPDLNETDYIRRYFDEKTRNERCIIRII